MFHLEDHLLIVGGTVVKEDTDNDNLFHRTNPTETLMAYNMKTRTWKMLPCGR